MEKQKYSPLVGTTIKSAILKGIEIAALKNCLVEIEFNGNLIMVSGKDDWSIVLKQWEDDQEKCRLEYFESDEYKDYQSKRTKEVNRKQNLIDGLLSINLSNHTLDEMMDWLERFVDPSDDIDVKFEKKALADRFEAIGFVENFGVGESKEFFDKRENMGKYIMGQVINCLKKGMAPHPVALSFVEKYFALKS